MIEMFITVGRMVQEPTIIDSMLTAYLLIDVIMTVIIDVIMTVIIDVIKAPCLVYR